MLEPRRMFHLPQQGGRGLVIEGRTRNPCFIPGVDAGIETGHSGDRLALLEEARDYFWVQYKELVADGWKDAHPAFVDDPPDTIPEPVKFITRAVPEELLHRVRLQFFIERSKAGKLEAIPVSGVWERPAANLVDTPVSFSVVPIGISTETILEKGVAGAIDTLWIPSPRPAPLQVLLPLWAIDSGAQPRQWVLMCRP